MTVPAGKYSQPLLHSPFSGNSSCMVVNQQAQYIYYLYLPALSCWLPTLLLLLSESFNLSLLEGDHAVRVEALGWAAWALFSCQWKECGSWVVHRQTRTLRQPPKQWALQSHPCMHCGMCSPPLITVPCSLGKAEEMNIQLADKYK